MKGNFFYVSHMQTFLLGNYLRKKKDIFKESNTFPFCVENNSKLKSFGGF